MTKFSIIQQALGEQWDELPKALQMHYVPQALTEDDVCFEEGHLDIDYPRWMQPVLSVMGLFGVLINRREDAVDTVVKKWLVEEKQHWKRSMRFADGTTKYFTSYVVAAGDNRVIEYVNPFLGLQMAVSVEEGKVIYQGMNYVLKLGKRRLKIPNYLALGKSYIEESAVDDEYFQMDFTLVYPLLGQIFQYKGVFKTFASRDLKLG